MPNERLNAREKWNGLSRTRPASVVSEICSARFSSTYSVTVLRCQPARPPGAERFRVEPARGPANLDQRLELENGLPENLIVEEQARRERYPVKARIGIDKRARGVDVQICRTAQSTRVLRLTVAVARRHKGQFLAEVVQRRPGQAVDDRLSLAPDRSLRGDEQMEGPLKRDLERFVRDDPDDFACQAAPSRRLPPDAAVGAYMNARTQRLGGRPSGMGRCRSQFGRSAGRGFDGKWDDAGGLSGAPGLNGGRPCGRAAHGRSLSLDDPVRGMCGHRVLKSLARC